MIFTRRNTKADHARTRLKGAAGEAGREAEGTARRVRTAAAVTAVTAGEAADLRPARAAVDPAGEAATEETAVATDGETNPKTRL